MKNSCSKSRLNRRFFGIISDFFGLFLLPNPNDDLIVSSQYNVRGDQIVGARDNLIRDADFGLILETTLAFLEFIHEIE